MIAVWEVLLPTSVAKPSTFCLSNWAVSEGVKNAAFLCAHALADLALHLQNLLTGLDHGPFQAIDLLSQIAVGEVLFDDANAGGTQHQDFAPAHPFRGGYAVKNLFSLVRG